MTTIASERQHPGDAALTEIEAVLRGLRTAAPATLLPATLLAAGLADRYVTLDPVVAPVLVAWNGRGVWALTRGEDGPRFESRFRSEFGRPISRAAELPPRLARAVSARLAGDRRARVPVDWRGRTSFEQAVWKK